MRPGTHFTYIGMGGLEFALIWAKQDSGWTTGAAASQRVTLRGVRQFWGL